MQSSVPATHSLLRRGQDTGPWLHSPSKAKLPRIDCIFLTPSSTEFEAARQLMQDTPIVLHLAVSLAEARSLLVKTDAQVLLAEAGEGESYWLDALRLAQSLHPPRALVLAGRRVHEQLWISALEWGVFDVLRTPFESNELLRIVQNAGPFKSRDTPRRKSH